MSKVTIIAATTDALSKKDSIKISQGNSIRIKDFLSDHEQLDIKNPRYMVHMEIKPDKADPFRTYIICDDEGQLYSLGETVCAADTYDLVSELLADDEEFSLRFRYPVSKKTGRRFISCNIL